MPNSDGLLIMLARKSYKESSGHNDQSISPEAARDIWLKQFEDGVTPSELQGNATGGAVQDPTQDSFENFLTEEDKQLLKELNNTAAEFPDDKTIVDLFEDQVKKTPGNKAVIYKYTELSYQQLNAASNRFGDYLRKTYKVKPDDLVGIKLERSECMIIAI